MILIKHEGLPSHRTVVEIHQSEQKRWRYIRYEDGSEELYDHQIDPNEWTNLADRKEFAEIKNSLAEAIPAKQHPGLMAQDWFDRFQSSSAESVGRKRRSKSNKAGASASGK